MFCADLLCIHSPSQSSPTTTSPGCTRTSTAGSRAGVGAQRQHNRTGEDNADAHLKRQGLGREVVAVSEGRLDFVPWEQIFSGEFDGRRRKRVLVKISCARLTRTDKTFIECMYNR